MSLTAAEHFSSSTRFAHFCTAPNSTFYQKNRFEKTSVFSWKFRKICKCWKSCKHFANFQNFSLIILLISRNAEKRVFRTISLQRSVPMQPKTSNILPKFCQKLAILLRRRRAWRGLQRKAASRTQRTSSAQKCSGEGVRGLGSAKLANFAKFANFWRARSRLYQNKILQENMRLTAFFKLYKICILLHRCNLNF